MFTKSKNNKVLTLMITFFILSFSMFFANAQNNGANKDRDQSLTVAIDAQSCAIGVTLDSEDNCKANFGDTRGPCKNQKECICSKKDKTITWTPNKNKKIEIKFTSSSPEKGPFNEQCSLKSGTSGKVSCKIKKKGTFDYDVHVEGCAGKPYDPRIVIH